MSKQVNYNENLCAGAAIRDDKGRRISKLFESPHPKMTVGYAKNLIMPSDPTEQEFNFRQAGGGVIEDGVAVIDKVKGNSVVWNQPLNPQLARYERMNVVKDMGTTLKVQVTERYPSIQCPISLIKGHKYLAIFNHTKVNVYTTEGFYFDVNGVKEYTSDSKSIRVLFQDNQDYGAYPVEQTYEKPFFYDLTQMFGAGNEPTTYEEFLQRKPKVADEYAYNEGTIVNNKVEKVVTTGRNLCPYLEQGTLSISSGSEQPSTTRVRTPFIPISNKYSYCTMLNKWSIRNGCFYDRNKNFISSGYPSVSTGVLDSSSIPANAAFYRLIYSAQNGTDVVTPSYDVFMFAVGNTTIPTTKYEPYEEHTLDISWVKDIKDADGAKLFEDGMRSAGNAFDEAGKNKAVKRIGVKIFDGTENVAYADTSVQNNKTCITYFDKERIIFPNRTSNPNPHICNKFPYLGNVSTKSIALGSNVVGSYGYSSNSNASHYYMYFVVDGIMTIDSWKAHLADLYAQGNPLTVIYELAEPIEVEYDEKSLTYPVVAVGIEEAIASEPSTAFRADIGYGIDAVKTILDLKARVEALEGK